MIFKRAVANLRGQDWTAVLVELVIVILGVFIGQQVSNWNNDRLERARTERMVRDLRPELHTQVQNYRILADYYAVTRRYGDTAFAGWRGDPRVSDREFVIAAYQASQIILSGLDAASWAQIFGSDRLRDLDDPRLRELLAALMTSNLAALEAGLSTDYRRDVRTQLPEDVQDAIRKQCGDRRRGLAYISLPETCTLELDESRFKVAARTLRADPRLVGELRYHFSITAGYVETVRSLDNLTNAALRQMDLS